MAGAVTFVSMPRSKPKTSAEGKEQLSSSLARMASTSGAGRGIPITEVGFGQCRFVIDDRSFPALCCGEPTLGGSWCAQHRALVFVRVAVQQNGRRPAQDGAREPEKQPIAQPKAVPAVAALTEVPPAKAAKAPSPLKTSAGSQQKPEAVSAPRKERGVTAKDAKSLGAAPVEHSGATAKPDRGKKNAKSRDVSRVNAVPARAPRSGAAKAKSQAPQRSNAAKKTAKPAKKSVAKRPPTTKKQALTPSKKSPAKRPSAGKKSPAPRKRAAGTRPTSSKAAGRKRSVRKKTG